MFARSSDDKEWSLNSGKGFGLPELKSGLCDFPPLLVCPVIKNSSFSVSPLVAKWVLHNSRRLVSISGRGSFLNFTYLVGLFNSETMTLFLLFISNI